MIECLFIELGWAGQEKQWLSLMTHGPRSAQSVNHDLEPNISRPALPLSQ